MTADLVHLPRLRQVAVVTRDRERVEADLVAMLDARLAERYPGVDQFGLGTAFYTVGNEFFEVVHAAVPGSVADRLIDRRGGDAGFIVMLECDGQAAYEQRAAALGIRVVDRTRSANGSQVQFHPKDTGGIYLAVTEITAPGAGDDDGPWMYGGPSWRDGRGFEVVAGIIGAELACAEPLAVAARWSELLDLPWVPTGDGSAAMALRGGWLRFVSSTPGWPGGLVGVAVVSPNPREVRRRAHARRSVGADGSISLGGVRIVVTGT